MNKQNIFRDVCKFLSGAFFVTAGASWYLAYYNIAVPVLGLNMSPGFLKIRGFFHLVLFLSSFYFGYIRKYK